MVRVKRNTTRVAGLQKTDPENPSVKVVKSSVKVNGKLSSICSEAKITDFFGEDNLSCDNGASRLTPLKHSPSVSVLQQANNIVKKSPHRIEINTSDDKAPAKKYKSKTKVDVTDKTARTLTDYFPVRRSVRKTKQTVIEETKKRIEKAILTCDEDGLDVHYFSGKGRGVVATRNFVRGDYVVEYAGELISIEEARIREVLYSQDQNTGCYMYYFCHKNCQYCVDATPESSRLGRLVNHSRNGNLQTKIIEIQGKPHLVLLAKEDIHVGDELTYDYGDRSKESLQYHPWLAT